MATHVPDGHVEATVPVTPGELSPPTSSSAPVASLRPVLPRALVMLLGAAAAVIVLSGLRATAWLIGPAFLALVVVIALSPVQGWLQRHNWPGWLTTIVLIVLVAGLLAALALVLVVSLANLAALLPQYADRADELLQSLAASLDRFGVQPAQLQDAADDVSPARVVTLIGTLLAGLSGAVSSLVFLVCLLLFLSIEAGGIDRRLAAVADDRPGLATAFRSFARSTRSYLVVSTVFGLIVGLLDSAVLAIIGVPLPLLWGVLSFITNYVPNVGFVIGLVPPALLALLTLGVPEMLVVIAAYSVLNFVIQSLIQPRFVGDSVGLAMTTTFIALVFWAWLLGPLGALLAIPLTLLIKALLVDVDPTARWATALAGSLAPEPRTDKRGRRTPAAAAAAPVAPPA
jgi:predicted PurR-regulated permease PerM